MTTLQHQTTPQTTSVASPQRVARVAGVLYLLVVLVGGFAEGFVYTSVYAAGDAATTVDNLVSNSGLVRVGVAADLLQATIWVCLAMTLYLLLKPVHRDAARAMVAFAAIGAAITCLNAVSLFEGLRVATGAVNLSSLTPAGSDALVLLLADAQHYGLIAAQIFFGLWLVPLGYLVYTSGWFPRALGVLFVVGAVGYIVDVFVTFLVPDLSSTVHTVLAIPGVVAELWMVGYLLLIGVRSAAPQVSTSRDAQGGGVGHDQHA